MMQLVPKYLPVRSCAAGLFLRPCSRLDRYKLSWVCTTEGLTDSGLSSSYNNPRPYVQSWMERLEWLPKPPPRVTVYDILDLMDRVAL